jgi:HSP20 family protein
MTNALDFFAPKDLFNFGSMPIFKSWFDDLIPEHFTNSPKVNVKETDKAYEIEIANPGFSKDETNIKIENGVIYVSMTNESKEGEEDGEHKYHVKQWSKSSYQESWNLPENVIEDQITAKNNDGVLVITLPKKEETKKEENIRTIKIE